MNTIKYILAWKDNNWIKIYDQTINEMNIWDDFSYDMEMIDSTNNSNKQNNIKQSQMIF